jgi:hypothetical protein
MTPAAASVGYSIDEPGKVVLTNVNASLVQPNTIRMEVAAVNNVFARSLVTPVAGQRVDGLSILLEVNEVWCVADAADPSVVPYYLPIKGHMVLRLPNDSFVDSAAVAALVQRVEGGFQRTAAQTLAEGVNNPLHQVLRY